MPDIQYTLKNALKDLLYEFEASKPEVCLVPCSSERAESGCMKRIVNSVNPLWYRRMCADFPRADQPENKKKRRTIIKRQDTIRTIKRLIDTGSSPSKYAPYILDEAKRRLEAEAQTFQPWEDQF